MIHQGIYHNSFDLAYREPFGAVPRGSSLSLSLDIDHDYHPVKVMLHFIYDKSNVNNIQVMDVHNQYQSYSVYETTITVPEELQLVWYYFEVVTEEGRVFYGREKAEESGEGMVFDHVPPSWQVTVYNPEYESPTWWKHAIIYQIFPDRFCLAGELQLEKAPKTSLMHTHWNDDPIYIKDEDGKIKRWDFFGGNLQGIIAKLDYIQSLGVTAIYLNPIFQAESNHRYDTGDYHKVDPLLGTKEDLEKLLIEAGKRNIEIMLDGVFSHTGSNSLYFNQKGEYPSIGAYQSVESPYYSWYNFQHHPDLYDAWWGIETLPTLNKENESYQQFLIHNEDSVIKAWQKAGVKNWRLDVADELTDDLIKQIYQQLKKENSSSVLLGEVWEDASNKIAYGKRREYLLGGELDSVMNYPLRQFLLSFMNGEWNAHTLKRKLLTLYEHYPKQYFYATMNMLSNHDVERLKTVLDGFMSEKMPREEKNRRITEQIKALSLWIYTFPGVPSLYYGDEAGLTGGEDPDNRKPYPWGREEKELVTWYQTIGGWRREYSALRTGHWKPHVLHNDVLAFERWNANGRDAFGNNSNNEHFLYLMNRNLHEEVEITLPIRQGKWQHLLDYRMFHETVRISPCECMLLKLS